MQPNTPGQVPGQPYNTQYPQQQMPPMQQPQTAAQIKRRHTGRGMLVALVLVTLLLLASLGFGGWAFMERQDYKNNVDAKIAGAVDEAIAQSRKAQEAEFAEREKEPFRTYQGPSQFGSVSITYPKTWSVYANESGKGSTPIDGYMHPNFVPGVDSDQSFALTFQVVEKPYDQVLDSYSSAVKRGTVNVAPVTLEKVPSVGGSRVNGEVENGKQGSVVIFPLRDKTLKVSVLSEQFLKDFENTILKHLSFTP